MVSLFTRPWLPIQKKYPIISNYKLTSAESLSTLQVFATIESIGSSTRKVLLQFSTKDEWHLGEYKKHPNHVAAFDSMGNQIGIIMATDVWLEF